MKVYRLKSGTFVLQHGNCHVAGDTRYIIGKMRDVGVELDEIRLGLTELVINNHGIAEYGDINHIFLYTKAA